MAIACLHVHDDLEDLTVDVNLEDVVWALDHPHQPGAFRSPIVTLLKAEILDRSSERRALGAGPFR